MSGRVLVVDDLPLNVKLLEAKLSSEYFDVITASSGYDALEVVRANAPDIVLLDVMMPGMDGFEVCRAIKADPAISHIPVVMVTALSDVADRVRGLEAGADDFLTKPVNDVALFARVRSLLRVKMMLDELRLREQTDNSLDSVGEEIAIIPGDEELRGRILIVADEQGTTHHVIETLEQSNEVVHEADGEEAVRMACTDDFDLVIVSLHLQSCDGLRLCSQLRSRGETRPVPLLVLIAEGETEGLVKGLELGVNDYLVDPIDDNELRARTRTQVRSKRYQDRLRLSVRESVMMAMTDGLTGLHNRRYFDSHLENMVRRAADSGKELSVLMVDVDHFKRINDSYGHLVGDEVLRELSDRIGRNIRGIDLAARYGGEEFVVAMPDCDAATANAVADRLREVVAEEPFHISADVAELTVTASIGVAVWQGSDDTAEGLMRRADQGLYAAKEAGRNRVWAVAV